MIDKIIDLKDNMPVDIYNSILNDAIEKQDARILFLLAYFVKDVDKVLLGEEVLKTDNLRYISFFMRSIVGIDKKRFIDKILALGNERDAYYCLFDNRDLEDEEIFKLIEKSRTNQNYYFLCLYHYFIVLDKFNNVLFSLVKEYLNKLDIDVDKENYRRILMDLKDEMINYGEVEIKEFSHNKYIGRKNYIPDMIVLHSTPSYNKAIKNFYDETKEVSAHFIINIDGKITQLVSLDDSAWANGTSLNTDSDVYYRFASNEIVKSRNYNANYYTFSIEHVSMDGELTDKQYESSKEIIKKIIKYLSEKYNYEFIIDDKHIVGHRDVNPVVRTVCPGNKFPMEKLIADLQKEV